ncbi:MAG: glycosyltransferase [Acidimicrobiales bacterium]
MVLPTPPSLEPRRLIRACHIIHSLAPGGAERVLVQLAASAPAMSIDLSVISLVAADDSAYVAALRDKGAHVDEIRAPSRWDPRTLWRAVRAAEQRQPDIIHTHLKHADIVGALAARRLGCPQVSTLHEIQEALAPVPRFKRRVGAWARIHSATRTVTVSEAQRTLYLRTFPVDPRSVVTIRNGIDLHVAPNGTRQRIRAEWGLDGHAVAALMLAVMRPGKGHFELLDAVERIPPDSPLHFVLAGDGPLRAQLQAHVTARSLLRGRITFLGWREDVADLLPAADLVVHPTLFDSLPTALIEAVAGGLPVVATRVGGVPEIVDETSGILVEPGQRDELAAALMELGSSATRRQDLGAGARLHYEREFSAGRWGERLRSLYDELLAG